ncbi:MAG: acyl-[acyl-carrier-protein] thioesterase [Clostridia bacterium]|nr:acyl-[acyl-carrier-protein] thioesterase [Clostridia bacterium]
MYTYKSRVRFSECNKDLKLSTSGLVNYFQDTSTFHSEDIEVGIDFLKNIGCAWVLSYWYIEIKRMPLLGEEIELVTWPYGFKGVAGLRNFLMKSAEGEVLACADTQWAYIDLERQRLKKVDDYQLDLYKLSPRYDMPETTRRIQVPESSVAHEKFLITKDHLDLYNHVNNEKYIHLAAMYLPDDYEIGSIRVEYKQQAVLGDWIYPEISETDGLYTVVLNDDMGKVYAVVEFNMK